MTRDRSMPADRLRSTLAYLAREAARRAAGGHPGMIRLDDDELAEVAALIRREVGEEPHHATMHAGSGAAERRASP